MRRPSHLYMRTNGGSEAAQTVDVGAYRFLGANEQDTEVLLESESGVTPEILLYDVETATSQNFSRQVSRPVQRGLCSERVCSGR